jgi:hypothetical protein
MPIRLMTACKLELTDPVSARCECSYGWQSRSPAVACGSCRPTWDGHKCRAQNSDKDKTRDTWPSDPVLSDRSGHIKFKKEWIERFIEEHSTKPRQAALWSNRSYELKRCPKCSFENKVKIKEETVTCSRCDEIFWWDRRRAGKPPKQRRMDARRRKSGT